MEVWRIKAAKENTLERAARADKIGFSTFPYTASNHHQLKLKFFAFQFSFNDMDDFQAATQRFLTWFKSVGGEFRDDLLEIKDLRLRDAGRGIGAPYKDSTIYEETLKKISCLEGYTGRHHSVHNTKERYHQHRNLRTFEEATECLRWRTRE
jgi:hypothetical protein